MRRQEGCEVAPGFAPVLQDHGYQLINLSVLIGVFLLHILRNTRGTVNQGATSVTSQRSGHSPHLAWRRTGSKSRSLKKIRHASRMEMPRSDTTCLAISRRRDGLTTFLCVPHSESRPLNAPRRTSSSVWRSQSLAPSFEPPSKYPCRRTWHATYKTF